MIGPEKSHHHLSYLLAKLKPSQPGRPPFLALQQFGRFYFKVSLALNGISFLLTDLRDYFGFGFTTHNRKAHLLVETENSKSETQTCEASTQGNGLEKMQI